MPAELAGAPGAEDAKRGFKKRDPAPTRRGPSGLLVVGLGERDDLDAERARVAAAIAATRGRPARGTIARLVAPGHRRVARRAERVRGLVEGAILASYRFDRFKSDADEEEERPPRLEELEIADRWSSSRRASPRRAETARVAAEAANRARELQNLPSNFVTPSYLAERALEIAATARRRRAEVMDREEIAERGWAGSRPSRRAPTSRRS